jgi:hypothetical protein
VRLQRVTSAFRSLARVSVELQILRLNAPTSEPLGVRTSSWYSF